MGNWTCNACNTLVANQSTKALTEITFDAVVEAEVSPMLKTPRTLSYQNRFKVNSYTDMSVLELKMNNIKSKVKDQVELEDTDLETSLTLAAEAGNLLLAENCKQKNDIEDLNIHNSALVAKVAEMEAKLEEVTQIEEKYLSKIVALEEKLQEALTQIVYGKKIGKYFKIYTKNKTQIRTSCLKNKLTKYLA